MYGLLSEEIFKYWQDWCQRAFHPHAPVHREGMSPLGTQRSVYEPNEPVFGPPHSTLDEKYIKTALDYLGLKRPYLEGSPSRVAFLHEVGQAWFITKIM
jgi:hypothetical protein